MSKIIALESVTMRYGSRTIFDDVNLDINSGDFVAITGPNGGGKTTLLKIILKLLKPTCGHVSYLDTDGHTQPRLPIGYLPQKNMIDSSFPIDVRTVIASGLLGKGVGRDETDARIERMLELVGLQSHRTSTIGELSGGQLQRALLGRALIADPKVIVLDEPLSYIDKRFEHRIYDIIARIAPGRTILLVSHEMSTIAEMANRHLIIDHDIHECHAAHHFAIHTCDQ